MPKLKRFNKSKISTKNVLISFAIIIGLLTIGYISKSYAIYKLEKKYDLIQSKIGEFSMGDVRVAVLVDGKEASEFPSYETNYKVEKIECTNGVTATFDVENWQLNIADMSATSTKCTVSFNSKETNEIKPVNMSKTELLALNEEIKNTSAKELADYLYPVGSIYMSTEDDTIEKVQNKFGGTWVKYSSGTTLVGDDGENYITNDESKGSGGNSKVKLNTDNIPSLSINGTTDSTGEGYTFGYTSASRTTSTTGAHYHNVMLAGQIVYWKPGYVTGSNYGPDVNGNSSYGKFYTDTQGNHAHTVSDYYANTLKGVEAHTHTFDANYTNDSQTDINVQNPYTVVYMYKRTA
ncbi:MAG: hypothetical protein J6B98_04750 [Bacilli bacterium]|nr:hypothetical protein [Bacilli bacterium]